MVILNKKTALLCFSVLATLCVGAFLHAEGHDGDSNIFPGNAIRVSPYHSIKVVSFGKGFAGEVVPPEDSDRIPRIGNAPTALEFTIDGEVFRFTHNFKTANTLKVHLEALRHDTCSPHCIDGVHMTYYDGRSFRDRVNRVSYFFGGGGIAGKYLEASLRYLEREYLLGKSATELRIMRNEIYARYGYIFKDPYLRNYFRKQQWYKEKHADVWSMLNKIETENIKSIQRHEKMLQKDNEAAKPSKPRDS